MGIDPVTGSTVPDTYIGRVVPGSGDRFNGSFQAGQGINDQLQSGTAFRASPRVGIVYDVTGKSDLIVRGGFGIFYDRPQGNMVFDMITNAPGVLQSSVQWGQLQSLASNTGAPAATLSLNPTVYNFKPPQTTQYNVGIQKKLFNNFTFDLAYVGSKSDDLLRQVQINALPVGADFLPQNQDPTRAPNSLPGANALPTDLLRPYLGYGGIRMWDYSGYGNYNSLQTGINRRFDNGLMFSFFYVWSKALTIADTDFSSGANVSDSELRRLDYSLANYDRPHNFVTNFIYQVPNKGNGAMGLLLNDWQLSGVYRWTSGLPYSVNYSIPGVGNANLTGNDGFPAARIVLTCDPGTGYSGDVYRQLNSACLAPPQPGSIGGESSRYFVRYAPINNLDLSLSKAFTAPHNLRFEVRLDMFNALNHTQITQINNTANFASLTDRTITNLPFNSAGVLTQPNGFGAVTAVDRPRSLQLVTRVTF
jgi:hypothetical protein